MLRNIKDTLCSKYLLLTILFQAFVLQQISGKEELIDFQLGYYVESATIFAHDSLYYRLIISDDYIEGEDVIVKILPLDYDSDPDIYISKIHMYPNSSVNSEWQCASYGKDTCTIHSKDVKKGDSFFIGVTCPVGECNVQVITMMTNEFELEDGVEFQTEMIENQAKIFKFTIPYTISDDSHIVIKGSSYSGSVHDFSMSVSSSHDEGDDTTPSTGFASRKGVPAWKKGQVVRLTKQNFGNGWCVGCEIKILIDAQDAGYYHIMAQTSESYPLVYNGDQIDDIVDSYSSQCYRFYVHSESTNLRVSLSTYSGRVQLYAHPEFLLENWDDFSFQQDDDLDTLLDIEPLERQQAGVKSGLYYVCVRGYLTSTYTVKFTEQEQDLQTSQIQDGYSEVFTIQAYGLHTHLYQVPKLDYLYEDFKIEFDLTLKNGAEPVFAAMFCENEDPIQCRDSVTEDNIKANDTKFVKAQHNGQIQEISVDHDESVCFSRECYYVVAILNEGPSSASYKLLGSHTQNNHILLQEGTPHVDSVEMKQFKYFKFTILDATNITSISFEVNPLHGDSDLFVSRDSPFPDKLDYDKKSQKSGTLVDHVTFQLDNATTNSSQLEGTYYIGVYGYSWATFSLLTHIKRVTQTEEETAMNKATLLYQGIPLTKSMHHTDEAFYSYFEVNLQDDEDYSILINLQNIQSKAVSFVKFGEIPTLKNYDFKVDEGTYQIKKDNQFYNKRGKYYIMTKPHPDLLQLLAELVTENRFTFTLAWRAENSIPHLNSQGILSLQTPTQSYTYLRHYLQDSEMDLKISLITKGRQEIFASVKPGQKQPTNDSYDFTTKFMKGDSYSKGKTLVIPSELIKKNNPSCVDLGYAETDACILHIGIYCAESYECSSQIEIEYESKIPKKLYSGQRKHQVMTNDSINYYYMTVNRNNTNDIFAILQPLTGKMEFHVTFQKFSLDESQPWNLPFSGTKHYFESETRLNNEMLHLSSDQISKCFDGSWQSFEQANEEEKKSDDDECFIVFGISATDSNLETHLIYNFVAYKDMVELEDQIPTYGYVQEGKFSYFLYSEKCRSCEIIISLTSQNQGIQDLYINKGVSLPTQNSYHFRKSVVGSQLISLDLNDTLFKENGVDSMYGYYVIGVYGFKNTTFEISLSSEIEPIVAVMQGQSIKHTQIANETVYFKYYHWYDKDFEIQLAVQQGFASIFVQTYDANTQNFIDQLPSSIDKSSWYVQFINPTNYLDGKEIIVQTRDRNYCTNCYYVIGVSTQSSNAMYTLSINLITDENESSSHLIKLGETKNIKATKNHTQIYTFMLESSDQAQVIPTVIKGRVNIYLSYIEDITLYFQMEENGKPFDINDSAAGENYFLFVEAVTEEAELTLVIHQSHTVLTLIDGTPQNLHYSTFDDGSKFMLFNMPTGNSTIVMTVKSKTKGFYPTLFYKLYDRSAYQSIDISSSSPWEQGALSVMRQWDHDLYVMQQSHSFYDLSNDTLLALTLLYHSEVYKTQDQKSSSSADAVITLSSSKIVRLQANEEYFGSLDAKPQSMMLFKVDIPKNSTAVIQHSSCVGNTQVTLLRDTQDFFGSKVPIQFRNSNGKETAILSNITGRHYILVESLSAVVTKFDFNPEFSIKIIYFDSLMSVSPETLYIPHNGGHITFEPLRNRKGEVKLQWGQIQQFDQSTRESKEVENVKYKVVFSSKKNINLDQVCAINKRFDIQQIQAASSNQEIMELITSVDPNIDWYFNVIAVLDDSQQVIPYMPISFKLPSRAAHGGWLIMTVLLAIFVLFAFMALYFYLKGKRLQRRLESEIRDVSGSAESGRTQTYHKVAGGGFNTFNDTQE